jgi:hypothetical protein
MISLCANYRPRLAIWLVLVVILGMVVMNTDAELMQIRSVRVILL